MSKSNPKKMKQVANKAGIYLLFISLFVACFFPPVRGFSEEWLSPKWIFTETIGLIFILILGIQGAIVGKFKNFRWYAFVDHGYVEKVFCETLVVIAFSEAIYSISLIFLDGHRSGTFENPAGLAFCLCVSVPFHVFLWKKWNGKYFYRYKLLVSAIVIVVAILCTQSRTGWICLGLYTFLWLQRRWKGYYLMKIVGSVVVIVSLVCIALNFKTDSTLGRRFILERSWDLILAHPFEGYGCGGFLQNYMPEQASYFKQNVDSTYAWLASEVYHPLNEFVWVWIEFGLLGVLLSIGLLVWIFIELLRDKTMFSNVLSASLCALIVFSLFSYPLKYPLASVVLIVAIGRVCVKKISSINIFCCRWISVVGVLGSVVGLIIIAVSYSYEYKWSKVARYSLHGYSQEMMPQYAELYKHYCHNASFLYNYTIEQFYAGQYEGAMKTAKECMRLWPSYNLTLLTGDICRSSGNFKEAIRFYELAHFMCPVRFAPLEGLYYAYKLENELFKADSIAILIEQKRIKVNSFDVQRIKKNIYIDNKKQ